jgi:hypothetical protein
MRRRRCGFAKLVLGYGETFPLLVAAIAAVHRSRSACWARIERFPSCWACWARGRSGDPSYFDLKNERLG